MPETSLRALEESIFREYDLRGVYDRELTDDFAYRLGEVYAEYLREKCGGKEELAVSVGRDVRLSGEAVASALIDGITSRGVDVYDLGTCPTPLLYFSLFHLEVDGGIMITASHNPAEYNGFKVCVGKDTIHGAEIQELKRRYYEAELAPMAEAGIVTISPIVPPYLAYLNEAFADLKDLPPVKVAIDCGNGVAGILAADLYRGLGCEVIELYCEPDGRFPNHHPDPTVEKNLVDLIATVKSEGCDLGIAFDGDGDRLGAVDERGNVLWGDKLMLLYAADILDNMPGAKFIGEVKCSQVMYDEIGRMGGQPIMWKTGHSLIKDKIKVEKAALAGEMSGHFFFADRYLGYDDALYAAARLIEIVKKKKEAGDFAGMSSLFEGIPETHVTPELKVECADSRKRDAISALDAFFEEHRREERSPGVRDIITIDGLRIIFDEGWGLVRASNTQPVLVLRFEADCPERRDAFRAFVENALEEVCGLKASS